MTFWILIVCTGLATGIVSCLAWDFFTSMRRADERAVGRVQHVHPCGAMPLCLNPDPRFVGLSCYQVLYHAGPCDWEMGALTSGPDAVDARGIPSLDTPHCGVSTGPHPTIHGCLYHVSLTRIDTGDSGDAFVWPADDLLVRSS